MNRELIKDNECVSRKISIFSEEHPEWSQEKVAAASHGYCRSHGLKDAIKEGKPSREIGRLSGISMRKFSSLIRLIKSKKGLKIGHAGILPFKVELPQKNLNRLQTKLERLVTEESKYLTAEQEEQRSQYATYMKKDDSEENFTIELEDDIKAVIELYPEKNLEELEDSIIKYLTPYPLRNNVWVDSIIHFDGANVGMNNIIKAPITLAKEMVQEYQFRNDDGSVRSEYHLKDYDELKMSISGLNRLYMIIEHKDAWDMLDTIGCVRDIYADDKTRSIRGMGYFKINLLPDILKDALTNGDPFGVSIGFMAELGRSGDFAGKHYDHIQENIILDHLAILIDFNGRCPIESCGVNVEGEKTINDSKITLINKTDNYYNISKILLDFKETIEKQNQEEILGDNMQDDGFKDPKTGELATEEPDDQDAMLKKLRKWLAGNTEEAKTNLKSEIMKMLGDNKEMNDKEFEDALAAKNTKLDSMESRLKGMLIKEIKSFTDKFSDAKLNDMSILKLESISEIVSDPDIRTDKKAEVIPIAGTDAKDEKKTGEYKRVDPRSIFLDTNKEFILDSFIASNFGVRRK